MKTILIAIITILVSTSNLYSQKTTVFFEDFDQSSTIKFDNLTSGNWSIDATLDANDKSLKGTYTTMGTFSTTSNSINTTGTTYNYLYLSFIQICKVEVYWAETKIEISTDGGSTWTKLISDGVNKNCTYCSNGNYYLANNRFTEATYGDWLPGSTTAPDNYWWKPEIFEISDLALGKADVKIRFLIDAYNSGGMLGRAGWFIDNVKVELSNCDPINTETSIQAPYYQGDYYGISSTYTINSKITDHLGASTSVLKWKLNGSTTSSSTFTPSSSPNPNNTFHADMSATFQADDVISYWIESTDNTSCNNLSRFPSRGAYQFTIHDFVPRGECDDFEPDHTAEWNSGINNIGSVWQIGNSTNITPNYPNTTLLGTSLDNYYKNNSLSYIYSLPYDLSVFNNSVPELSFQSNYNLEPFYDGVSLEYTIDNGLTWNVLGNIPNDPNASAWYNAPSVISSNGSPVWTGTTNNNWVESTYNLSDLQSATNILFRFKFSSDGTLGNFGFNIDDFCVKAQ